MNTKILKGVLSRNEMKSIKGGGGGNIICDVAGNQQHCECCDLLSCTDKCITDSEDAGGLCGGCAEFPPL